MRNWLDALRLWLWRRQERQMRAQRGAAGTTEGDWIGANVAGSAASSGAWAGSGQGSEGGGSSAGC